MTPADAAPAPAPAPDPAPAPAPAVVLDAAPASDPAPAVVPASAPETASSVVAVAISSPASAKKKAKKPGVSTSVVADGASEADAGAGTEVGAGVGAGAPIVDVAPTKLARKKGGKAAATKPSAEPEPSTPTVPEAAMYSRLDEADLEEARALGLLRPDLEISRDATKPEFGMAYEKNGGTREAGCGTDVFAGQKRLQERCKQFAMLRGFQLIVAGSSTRANGGGNVKYRCKKLHGQQFLDPNTDTSELHCPFYINGFGKGAAWKVTRVNFLHNHHKFIGSRPLQGGLLGADANTSGVAGEQVGQDGAAKAEGKPGVRLPTQRNTTMSTKTLCKMVNEDVKLFPAPSMAMSKLDGKTIKLILLHRGHAINHMMASRIKRVLHEDRVDSIRTSFQKLASYLKLMAEKNPGSLFQVETNELGVFKRALFIPGTTMHAFKHCRKLIALDHITPTWNEADPAVGKVEDTENDDAICGVYLKATSKDFNDQPVTFALALVVDEDQSNWEWFLNALQMADMGNLSEYTVVAGRSRGLQQALQSTWPQTSHHFCMRRIVEEEIVMEKRIPMTEEKKQRLYALARSESESDFNSLRNELLRTNESAVLVLDGINKAHWVKYAFLEAFRKPTFNEITCDLTMASGNDELFSVSATHTSWFGDDLVRSSQPLQAFGSYFRKIAENFHHRTQSAEKRSPHELVPVRAAQLALNLQGSQRCESIPCANGAFMVRSLGQTRPQIYDTWRHVNLLDWECTCQEWQDRLFPCVHGIHAAELDRRRIDSLYSVKENSVDHYRAGYSMSFTPWPIEAASLDIDYDLKTPLDYVYADDDDDTSGERKKPGPRPKMKKAKTAE